MNLSKSILTSAGNVLLKKMCVIIVKNCKFSGGESYVLELTSFEGLHFGNTT